MIVLYGTVILIREMEHIFELPLYSFARQLQSQVCIFLFVTGNDVDIRSTRTFAKV